MEKAGCGFGDKFIKAVHCDKKIAGGYVRGAGVLYIYIYIYVIFLVLRIAFDLYSLVATYFRVLKF